MFLKYCPHPAFKFEPCYRCRKQFLELFREHSRILSNSKRQIGIYYYNKYRSWDVAKNFLGDFDGCIQSDGYANYNKLTKVTHCNCCTHVLRKIYETAMMDCGNSIVETAKANWLDVFKCCELLLTVLPSIEFLTNPDILEKLLPWNSFMQKIFKAI